MFADHSPIHVCAMLMAYSGYDHPPFMMSEEECRLKHLHDQTHDRVCTVCGYFRRCGTAFCPHCVMMEYERCRVAWLVHIAIMAGELDPDYYMEMDSYDQYGEIFGDSVNIEDDSEIEEFTAEKRRPRLLDD